MILYLTLYHPGTSKSRRGKGDGQVGQPVAAAEEADYERDHEASR